MKTFRFTKQQEQFINADHQVVIFSGAVGAGKSYAICCDALRKCMQYPGNRVLICRDNFTDLRKSTLQTLLTEIIPEENIVNHNKTEHKITIQANSKGETSEIWYEGLDKGAGDQYPKSIGSTQFGSIYVDEGYELDKNTFDFLLTRIRYTATNENGEKCSWQLKTATNPGGPNHWMKQSYIDNIFDEDLEDVEGVECPKCGSDRVEFIRERFWKCGDCKASNSVKVINVKTEDNNFIDEQYLSNLKMRYPEGSMMRQRLLEGKWVASEGLVYPMFDINDHVVSKDKFLSDYNDYKEIVVGADSGWTNPRALLVVGVTGSEELHVLDEFYRSRTGVEEAIEWLESRPYKVDRIFHDPSEPEEIKKFKRNGVTCFAATNDIIPGINAVSKKLGNDKVLISKDCTNFVNELLSYRYPKSSGRGKDKNKDETPIKEDDHLCDGFRYLCIGLDNRSRTSDVSVGSVSAL